jgi:hypothetical protein
MSGDLSSSSLNEGHSQTLRSIQELQTMEKNLYAQLQSSSANSGNVEAEERIIKRINEISEMRNGLFKTLTDKYKTLQNSVAETRVDLVDQMTVVGIVEGELNKAKANLNSMKNAKSDKMRMVEINTYYEQRYLAHTGIIKLIIMMSVPLLILAILTKKEFIPSNIANGLAVLIIVVGLIIIIYRVADLSSRDNMNYDEIDWKFKPEDMKSTFYQYDKNILKDLYTDVNKIDGSNIEGNIKGLMGLGCMEAECCSSGMVYDKSSGKCVLQKTTDGFRNLADDVVAPWGNNSTVQSFNPDYNAYALV